MVTISHLVKDYIDNHPFIAEGLSRGIISHAGLAEEMLPGIEAALHKDISLPAVVMAIRRHAETIHEKNARSSGKIRSTMNIKTGLCVIAVKKSPRLFKRLGAMQSKVRYEDGDMFNVSHGNNEVSIILDKKYEHDFLHILKGEKILGRAHDLVSMNIIFSKEYLSTQGVIFDITRKLAWNNINIIEMISANSELSILIKKDDAARLTGIMLAEE